MSPKLITKAIEVTLKSLVLLAGATVLCFALRAPAQEQGVRDFEKMKYGLFVHYVWGGTAYAATVNPDGTVPAGLDDLANRFDATRFADDLASMKVEYVIFTAWHANMNCLWPSAKMQRWLPGHASQRDVLRDMIAAVRGKGIRVVLYTHPSDGHDLTPAEQAATGWGPTFNRAKWNDFINDIYGDLISRYGKDIEGVYIDEHGGQNASYVDYARLRETIKAHNVNLLMLQNDYGNIYDCDLGEQEVVAFKSTDGNTWPASGIPCGPLISCNWWASKTRGLFSPRYSPECIFRYTVLKAGISASAGGTTWAAGCYPGGGWETGILETMRQVASYLQPIARSVTNTYPSISYPTAVGTTIEGLKWGVATMSTDGRYEYIHVLNAPNGRTLRLPAPADGKEFDAARLLANNDNVGLMQFRSGVTLTLRGGDSWDQLDTVIELTVAGKSSASFAVATSDNELSEVRSTGATYTSTNSQMWDSNRALNVSSYSPTPGMARWFDASVLKLTDGATVARWNDLSGNDAPALCAAGSNRLPRFMNDAGTGTGLGAIHFGPGTEPNPALDSEALTFRADTNIRAVFSVFKGGSFLLTDYGAIHFHRPDDTNAASPLWSKEFTSPNILGGATYVNGLSVDGTAYFMPTNLHGGFNLVEVLTTNTVTASGFNKDRYCHAGDQYLAEVLIYDFPLTDAQRSQTEAYLKAKWFGGGSLQSGKNESHN